MRSRWGDRRILNHVPGRIEALRCIPTDSYDEVQFQILGAQRTASRIVSILSDSDPGANACPLTIRPLNAWKIKSTGTIPEAGPINSALILIRLLNKDGIIRMLVP
jgi:hypothetical protein